MTGREGRAAVRDQLLRTALVVVLSVASARTAVPECLHYEPTVVRLQGVVARKTFAGPPNYESVAAGDAAETYWILTLASPVCIARKPDDEVDVAVPRAARVQLVLKPDQYKEYARLVGRRVWAKGTLFHAITGHHHEDILLELREIGAAEAP